MKAPGIPITPPTDGGRSGGTTYRVPMRLLLELAYSSPDGADVGEIAVAARIVLIPSPPSGVVRVVQRAYAYEELTGPGDTPFAFLCIHDQDPGQPLLPGDALPAGLRLQEVLVSDRLVAGAIIEGAPYQTHARAKLNRPLMLRSGQVLVAECNANGLAYARYFDAVVED